MHYYKMIRDICINQAGFIVSIIVTFFLSPYIVHTLGNKEYGIWSLLTSVTGHYSLLSLGIQGATSRYIAYAIASRDEDKLLGYFNTSLYFLLSIGIICILLGIIIAFLLPKIFKIPSNSIKEAQITCVLISITAAISFVFATFQCVLIAYKRFDITNLIGIFSTIIRAIATVWLLAQGYSIIGLACLSLILTLMLGILQFFILRRVYSKFRFSFKLAKRIYFKDLITYGLKSFIINLGFILSYQCDLFVIGIYFPPEVITIYSLAAMLITYIIQFISNISRVFVPYITEQYAKSGIENLGNFFIKTSCIMYMLGGLSVGGCLIFGKSFFSLWLGSNYYRCATIFMILSIPLFFTSGARIGSAVCSSIAQLGPMSIASICEGVFNILLSLFLVRYIGVIGVALGTLIPIILIQGLWFPLYLTKVMYIKRGSIFYKSMFPAIIVMSISLIIGYAISKIFPPVSWGVFALDIFLMVTNYILVAQISFSKIYGHLNFYEFIFRSIGINKLD